MATVFGVAEIERIVALAKRYPIFPCHSDKSPRVERGLHAATQDEKQIRAWWRQWPDALVGVPTGQGTGLVVIDYDPDKATQATHAWMADHTELLCSTRSHKTGRGGLHYVFQSKDRYQTGVDLILGGSPRRGIDLRANGGYVIWWPAHIAQEAEAPIAPLPADLIDERRFDAQRDMAPLPTATPQQWRAERTRAAEALTFLAPDGYEHWIRTGMAIHAASGGSDDGFALWHDWSARGASYDGIEDCRYHWGSFGRYAGRGVGLGSLYAAAKAAGYVQAAPRPELPPVDVYEGEPAAAVPSKSETAAEEPERLMFRHIAEIVAERREPDWLIEDVIEANVLAILAGKRGTYKSFVALDWSMRIASVGRPVVILSGEGAGLDRRADAWMRTHAPGGDIRSMPVYALERAINLNAEADLAQVAGAAERMAAKPALIVIDTLSKFSAGVDENDNGEMSTYMARLSAQLRDEFGCTILLVAHAGHGDGNRPRGASALMANPDAEYIISRVSPLSPFITVSRERFKDTPALEPLSYEAKVVDLGRHDRRGRPVTSLALRTTETSIAPPMLRPGVNQGKALTALREYHRANPEAVFVTSMDLQGMLKAQGVDRKRRLEVTGWLVQVGVLTNSIGGHTFDPRLL